jgi:hypothetical protein
MLVGVTVGIWGVILSPAIGVQHWPTTQPHFQSGHERPPRDLTPPKPGPRRTAPALPPERLRRDAYQSVQVNVDEYGYNILGDAANEPSVAIDPTDPKQVVIGWRQFDSVTSNFRQAGWAYSHSGGNYWVCPGVVDPGVFRSDPILAADAAGIFYYYSLEEEFVCDMFRSTDHGLSWVGPIPAWGGDKAWLAIDRTGGIGDGNIYAAWDEMGTCWTPCFIRSLDGGFGYDFPVELPTSIVEGTVAVGPDGTVYISGRNYSNSICLVRSSDARDPAASPTFDLAGPVDLGGFVRGWEPPNPGGLLSQVWVACNYAEGPLHGEVYLCSPVCLNGGNLLDVMFAYSSDRGQTWSQPVRINDDAPDSGACHWFASMSVAPNGRIDVTWNDTRNSTDLYWSEVFYSYSEDGGRSWAPNQVISPPFNTSVGWPAQSKLGDYYHMISDDLGADFAYAATFNGEQDIYFLRLGQPDCNGNGIADQEDISLGLSADVNGNGVPDECERDCNGNQLPDDYDIASGGSQDCNQNSVPDECEPGGTSDCNENGVADLCDIYTGTSQDCNQNKAPDECDIATGYSPDCNANGVPDECDIAFVTGDCNGNGVPDECDLLQGTSVDCQPNGVPDECEPTPMHDNCSDAVMICPGYTYFGQTLTATSDGSSSCDGPGASPDVWYYFRPLGSGYVILTLCGSDYDTVLSVHSACPGSPENQLACNDDSCASQSYVRFFAQSSRDYWIRIAGHAGASGTFRLMLSGPGCAFSPMCDDDGIPDECEPDCNQNGRPDDCDIADGASQDLNGNGIPDECEGQLADVNCDGLVNTFDIDPFVLALTNPTQYAQQFPGCPLLNADTNCDGAVNTFDIDPFVICLTSGCAPCAH